MTVSNFELIDLTHIDSNFVHTQTTPTSSDSNKLPTVLTIAGSDCSGGAGIEADLKTITSLKCYGLTCIDSITIQNPNGLTGSVSTDNSTVLKILENNFKNYNINSIKTGLITNEILENLNDFLKIINLYHFEKSFVLDPVIVTNSGDKLNDSKNLDKLISIFKYSSIITPNIQECETILNQVNNGNKSIFKIESYLDLIDIAQKIINLTNCKSILIKGGHIPVDEDLKLSSVSNKLPKFVINLYLNSNNINNPIFFKTNYLITNNTHGTGCSLSSSIACYLSKNYNLIDSIKNSLIYTHLAILNSDKSIGNNINGPINHMFNITEFNHNFTNHQNNNDNEIEIIKIQGNLKDYLINHESINKLWLNYINHDFIKLVSTNKLSKSKFNYFLLQDYAYLINYGKIHALSATISPNLKYFKLESEIILNVCNEMEKHKLKLNNKFPNLNFDKIKINNACNNYNNYLINIVNNTKDYLKINIALSPCLFGYNKACEFGLSLIKSESINESEIDKDYLNWLNDYVSDWYIDACQIGNEILNEFSGCELSKNELNELIKIFKDVINLEILFWDAILEYESCIENDYK
ncbi:catalytic activity protein [[Candida] boidinii]|nr:catalytic activity protein [[Candida] boidinii]